MAHDRGIANGSIPGVWAAGEATLYLWEGAGAKGYTTQSVPLPAGEQVGGEPPEGHEMKIVSCFFGGN